MAKSKIKDISPKYSVRTAADELKYEVTPGELPMADNWGGFQVFSRSFKRGYGDNVFGLDERGLWMGAAEFEDAPLRMYYTGASVFTDITVTGYVEEGGAAADVNSGATKVQGGQIADSTLTATQLANNAVTSTKITDNAVTTNKINANAVTAGKISVSTLSAISANLGTITAGTVTGATIRTASSGYRVQMDNDGTVPFKYWNGTTYKWWFRADTGYMGMSGGIGIAASYNSDELGIIGTGISGGGIGIQTVGAPIGPVQIRLVSGQHVYLTPQSGGNVILNGTDVTNAAGFQLKTNQVGSIGTSSKRMWDIYAANLYYNNTLNNSHMTEDIELSYVGAEDADVVIQEGGKIKKSTKANDRNVFGVVCKNETATVEDDAESLKEIEKDLAKPLSDRLYKDIVSVNRKKGTFVRRETAKQKLDGRPVIIGVYRIKVTGKVQTDDFLVTSDVPAHAMTNNDAPSGAVIATALENFNGKSGIIRAMVRKF